MQWLSQCCQSTTVAHLSLTYLTLAVLWLRWQQPSFLSHLLPCVCGVAPDIWASVVFLCSTVHPNTDYNLRTGCSSPSALINLVVLRRRQPVIRRDSHFTDIHQEGIISREQLLPSRLFCLLQSSDVQPFGSLLGFRGQRICALHVIISSSFLRRSEQSFTVHMVSTGGGY